MIEMKKSDIIAVAVRPDQYPEEGIPEIAFTGRSNVGKSTLLNFLTGRKNLARVSSSPGKTRTINFYLIDDEIRIVDLPGYGYAKVSKAVSEKWGQMMEMYLSERKGLKSVIQLVDSRHKPTQQDIQMYEYLRYYGLEGAVVATKADKLSKRELAKNISVIRKELNMDEDQRVIPVSALKKQGRDELIQVINEILEG